MLTYHRTFLIALVVLVALMGAVWEPRRGSAPVSAGDDVRVIVEVDAPALLPGEASNRGALVARIRSVNATVIARLPRGVVVERAFDGVPAFVVTTDAAGARALERLPGVRSVTNDLPIQLELAEASRLIRASDAHTALGVTGAGVTVAVIDTGIDTDHPDLVGDIAFEECFMLSGCPLGGTHSSGPGAAEDDNGHGTSISGVITSTGNVAPSGIAPDTNIGAYKVVSASGGGSFSDVLAALNDVIANHPEIRAVSMSLTDATNRGLSCDALFPPFTTAVNTLHAANTLVFAASGNEGFTNGLAFPSCISNVVSVGGVYDDTKTTPVSTVPCTENPRFDRVACFGNSASTLDLLGVGGMVTSSWMGGGTLTGFGTSIATPHAAAAAALLWSYNGALTSAQVETALETNGFARTDPKSGVTTPRLDVFKALASQIGDPDGDGLNGPSDNCPLDFNPGQENSDRNFIDTTPPLVTDDVTLAHSDSLGDACDADDDDDGLSDAGEAAGCNGSGPVDPLDRDSDDDRFLDGAECALSGNPANSGIKPLVTACGANVDADGDKLTERLEVCFYNTSVSTAESDADASSTGSHDGCEAASFNGDRIVNVADMGILAAAISNVSLRHVDVDVNKDGVFNVADQGIVASLISPSGQCP